MKELGCVSFQYKLDEEEEADHFLLSHEEKV